MTLLEALRTLRKDGPTCLTSGICRHVEDTMAAEDDAHYYASYRVMTDLFKRWPEFSGCLAYPIPAMDRGLPEDAYAAARGGRDMWDRNQPYGALRWELLDFMISELEKEQVQ